VGVEWKTGVCVFIASECRKFCRPSKECVRKGTKEGMCSERDKGRNVFGKGQRKGRVPFLTRVGTCKGTEGKVFANVNANAHVNANLSAGVDTGTLWGGGPP